MDSKIEELIKQMTLEEKVSLCSGADNWHTRSVDRLGIPAIRVTDGPHGVRRPYDDDHSSLPATSFPTASAMAATWNVDLVNEVGAALGVETRTKGCDVLLGPAVNIHRAPLCGRNFEYFSEDPYHAGRMATAYIQGLQSQNVGASIKHYAGNNAEFERFTISSEIDERALREIYLPAFETAVKESQPWTVMCSYNKVNGTWAAENHYLLTEILKEEWGFEGFVVSDWGAVHHRARTANAGLDLEMPGTGNLPVEILVNAVRSGQVSEAIIDDKVRRILRIVFKARPDGKGPVLDPEATDTPEHRKLARRAAAEAIVLLKNEGSILPIQPAKVRKIAVFGPAAVDFSVQGGGSARVNPYRKVNPLDAIRERAGTEFEVDFSLGCTNHLTPPRLDSQHVSVPGSSESGFKVEYFANQDFSGEPFQSQVEPAARLVPGNIPAEQRAAKNYAVRWSGTFTAPVTGSYTFSLTAGGQCRLSIDGNMVVDHWTDPDLVKFTSVWPWMAKSGSVELQAGSKYNLVIELLGGNRMFAGYEIPLPADENERVQAMAAAADLALVIVGTTDEHETEGRDRDDWHLPGKQVELIKRVAAVNPRTVVILNNGATVEIASWIDQVAGLVEAWFSGQEGGAAIADILFGDVNPSGKLPDTLPVRFEHNPSYLNYPGENGRLLYGESIFVGYRYFDAKQIEPLFPFGYGLSYTTFAYQNLRLSSAEMDQNGRLNVTVAVQNSGQVTGQEVVQLYLSDPQSHLVRPPKELKKFAKVNLQPGETQTVTFEITPKDLAYYDPSKKDWVAEPGEFEVMVGGSSRDIRARASFILTGPAPVVSRLNIDTRLDTIMADPQGSAVLAKHLPDLVKRPEFKQIEWATLRWVSLSLMDLLSQETVAAIETDLAKIL